jgi:inhibitor of cysteine peptidase
MLRITKDSSPREIAVRPGDTFEIEFPENPTTGYRWHLSSSNEPVLELQDDSFQPAGGTACGAGGLRRWRFQATQAGSTTLDLQYRRPWEQQPAQTTQIAVHVSK